jgi:hypothetical protein
MPILDEKMPEYARDEANLSGSGTGACLYPQFQRPALLWANERAVDNLRFQRAFENE